MTTKKRTKDTVAEHDRMIKHLLGERLSALPPSVQDQIKRSTDGSTAQLFSALDNHSRNGADGIGEARTASGRAEAPPPREIDTWRGLQGRSRLLAASYYSRNARTIATQMSEEATAQRAAQKSREHRPSPPMPVADLTLLRRGGR